MNQNQNKLGVKGGEWRVGRVDLEYVWEWGMWSLERRVGYG